MVRRWRLIIIRIIDAWQVVQPFQDPMMAAK
jgi:hypothetical protein